MWLHCIFNFLVMEMVGVLVWCIIEVNNEKDQFICHLMLLIWITWAISYGNWLWAKCMSDFNFLFFLLIHVLYCLSTSFTSFSNFYFFFLFVGVAISIVLWILLSIIIMIYRISNFSFFFNCTIMMMIAWVVPSFLYTSHLGFDLINYEIIIGMWVIGILNSNVDQ